MEHGVNVPLQLWGATAPGGWESTGAQVRGAGSPERASAYLASVESQGHILVWGLGSGSKAPSSGWGGSAGGRWAAWAAQPHASHLWLSPLSWLHCSSPGPGSPFKWNVPFALEPGGSGAGVPVQEQLPFLETGLSGIPSDTAAGGRWREGREPRQRTEEDQTDLHSSPCPRAQGWFELETGREQTPQSGPPGTASLGRRMGTLTSRAETPPPPLTSAPLALPVLPPWPPLLA